MNTEVVGVRVGGDSVDEVRHIEGPAALAINLPHHHINTSDNRRHIGDEAAAADVAGETEVGKAGRSGAYAIGNRILGVPADDVEAHLAARAFGFHVSFARWQVPRRIDAMRALRA